MTTGLAAPGELHGTSGLRGDELAWGWPYGMDTAPRRRGPRRSGAPARHPRTVLEDLLRPALAGGRVVVSFSGGRDSSALLALAVHVARQEDLPLPVALTARYGSDPAADESAWQELVVGHLGVADWVVVHPGEDADALGPRATEVLDATRSNVFPPGAAAAGARAAHARGAVLVDGEPGDWVLGPHRMTYPHQLVRRRGRAGRADWRAAADSCAPAVLRRVLAAREVDVLPWLRDDVRRRQRHAEALDSGLEPLRWDAALRSLERWRWHGLGIPTVRAVVRAYGAQPLQPLGDPAFVHALACWGGRVGLPSRTAAMRLLCGDLLPPEVLRRRSKATFNTQVFGPATRAFAERWDGSGVDPQRVDAERLRAEWLSPVPDARTLGLLQDAWLARRCLVQQVPA